MAMTIAPRQGASTTTGRAREAIIPGFSWPFLVSGALTAVTAAAIAVTFFVPGVLTGTAVMNGSARGTALVALVLALPVLCASMIAVARGSVRAVITWLGATAYLLYNSVMFLFATPFNSLFLLYVAMCALSIWTAVTVLTAIDAHAFAGRFSRALPTRAIAAYAWAVSTLNGLVWLVQVIPAILSNKSPAFLEGTGLTTNPVFVQDLSFWIPLTAVSAAWLWSRRAWGYVIVGVVLTMGVIESVGIAVDQAFGHAADPGSSVASAAMVPVFAVLAAIGLVPLFFYYRNLGQRGAS